MMYLNIIESNMIHISDIIKINYYSIFLYI